MSKIAAEIERLFKEQQEEVIEEEDVYARSLYSPPWRERLNHPTDLDLNTTRYGPFYGPESEAVYSRQVANYNESQAGGGLWDAEQDTKTRTSQKRRFDQDKVCRFATNNQLTRSERTIYSLFWVDLRSYGYIAKKLGIAKFTVKAHIQNIRMKAKV